VEKEKVLLKKAKELIPFLPFNQIDILIVDEMGKDISGTGIVNGWFFGVSSLLIIVRSLIVAHSVRSFFSASLPRICLRTFSTVSPVMLFFEFSQRKQHFKCKSLIHGILKFLGDDRGTVSV
jgi:hypothetical protein